VPHFADQFANAERVVAAGAGVAVTNGVDEQGRRRPLVGADADRIRMAIEHLLVDDERRAAARRISRAMADAPSPDEVLAATLAADSPA
jgi:UDP:flavonoid glycosyltransferase YjiC (YdhE family)